MMFKRFMDAIGILWQATREETDMAYTLQERRDIVNSKMIHSLASLISAPELMTIIHALNGDSVQNLASFNRCYNFEFPINGDVIARLV